MKKISVLVGILLVIISSCKKNSFITSADARISFSQDTISFDTVFTTVGSITQQLKVINSNDQKLSFTEIKLMGGSNSAFTMNVDGIAGNDAANIEVEANDSFYVFISVSVNPNNSSVPFVLEDSIRFTVNGTDRFVQLRAWGQNAHFYDGKTISGHVIWNNDLPYVILGQLTVDTGAQLDISAGTKVYFHSTAPMLIRGTLNVYGEKEQEKRVLFQGDRLDDPYNQFPAAWPGIFFSSSSADNILNYAVLRNAYQAIAADGPSINANPKVRLNECIIDNSYDAGITASSSSITAENCLVSNCGKNIVVGGGDYLFTNCTVASYSNDYIAHKEPVLQLYNYSADGSGSDLHAQFINCIFWGQGLPENEVTTSKQGTANFDAQFQNCLWKIKNQPANITVANMIANTDPAFDSINISRHIFDFHLKTNSPAIDQGASTSVITDLDGNPRTVNLTDIGCYEKQP